MFSWNSPLLLVYYLQEIATQPMLNDQDSRKQARMALETHFSYKLCLSLCSDICAICSSHPDVSAIGWGVTLVKF
ncbi:hypothetical protein Hdeb2414_s0013g00402291 [Helianthus debilis subsp. tardiflorus]